MKVKSSLPPRGEQTGWTVLLDCGHTLYDVRSKDGRRPKKVRCTLCEERR